MHLCLVLFLDRKPCFFARAFFVKTIRFSEVFFLPKILGREGGGRILGCALTPRWLELDVRCCMAKVLIFSEHLDACNSSVLALATEEVFHALFT